MSSSHCHTGWLNWYKYKISNLYYELWQNFGRSLITGKLSRIWSWDWCHWKDERIFYKKKYFQKLIGILRSLPLGLLYLALMQGAAIYTVISPNILGKIPITSREMMLLTRTRYHWKARIIFHSRWKFQRFPNVSLVAVGDRQSRYRIMSSPTYFG